MYTCAYTLKVPIFQGLVIVYAICRSVCFYVSGSPRDRGSTWKFNRGYKGPCQGFACASGFVRLNAFFFGLGLKVV